LANYYLQELKGIDEILPLSLPNYSNRHAWHLFIVRLDAEKAGTNRETFMNELKCMNIGTSIHFKPVHQHEYYRVTLKNTATDLVNTEWNGERIVSLPLFPAMNHEDVDDVVEAIKMILSKSVVLTK